MSVDFGESSISVSIDDFVYVNELDVTDDQSHVEIDLWDAANVSPTEAPTQVNT